MASSEMVKSQQTIQQSSSSTTKSMTSSTVKTSFSSSSVRSSSHQVVSSSGHTDSGLDIDAEIQKMRGKLDAEMGKMKIDALKLLPLPDSSSASDLIKFDTKSIQEYIDDSSHKLKLDFDVHEFLDESVVVKSDGNRIEVHAMKKVKKDGAETEEEYSRVYELPKGIDTKTVTSSITKDAGHLTIELPVGNLPVSEEL